MIATLFDAEGHVMFEPAEIKRYNGHPEARWQIRESAVIYGTAVSRGRYMFNHPIPVAVGDTLRVTYNDKEIEDALARSGSDLPEGERCDQPSDAWPGLDD